jgi:hypothetical protein
MFDDRDPERQQLLIAGESRLLFSPLALRHPD